MALRDSMRESAAQYLRPGEPIQAVIGEHLRQTVHTGVRCSYWPG